MCVLAYATGFYEMHKLDRGPYRSRKHVATRRQFFQRLRGTP